MIVIFGTKRYRDVIATLTAVCRACGNPAHQRVEKLTTKFSVFFIPLIPISTRYTIQCAMCGATSEIAADEAERLAASSR